MRQVTAKCIEDVNKKHTLYINEMGKGENSVVFKNRLFLWCGQI